MAKTIPLPLWFQIFHICKYICLHGFQYYKIPKDWFGFRFCICFQQACFSPDALKTRWATVEHRIQEEFDIHECTINRKKKKKKALCLPVFFLFSIVVQLLNRFIDVMYDYFSRNGREQWISIHTSFPIPSHQNRWPLMQYTQLMDSTREHERIDVQNRDTIFLALSQIRA